MISGRVSTVRMFGPRGLLCISLKLRTIQKSPVLGGSFASLWYTSTTGTSRTNLNAWSMRLTD